MAGQAMRPHTPPQPTKQPLPLLLLHSHRIRDIVSATQAIRCMGAGASGDAGRPSAQHLLDLLFQATNINAEIGCPRVSSIGKRTTEMVPDVPRLLADNLEVS